MSAKTDTPEQHNILHQYWAPPNCCLCNAEKRIRELERKVQELEGARYIESLKIEE